MWWMPLAATAHADSHVWARSIQRLELHNAAGDLHVEHGGDRIEVRLYPLLEESCDVRFAERADRAEVRIRDLHHQGEGCRVNVLVRLPLRARAELSVGAGDLHAVGLDAAVAATIGRGHVHLEGTRGLRLNLGAGDVFGWLKGDASLQVGSGHISLSGLTRPLSARVGSGDIELHFDQAPNGTVTATTGHGDIRVTLPEGDCEHTSLETHAGDGHTTVERER